MLLTRRLLPSQTGIGEAVSGWVVAIALIADLLENGLDLFA